jgi:glycosyltransferase involved in cell wall biosynthesis
MKHLIVSREFPPAPAGGIGTYVYHISRMLAEIGETVHVIGQLWEGADREIEEHCAGRLVVHRIPFEDWTTFLRPRPNRRMRSGIERDLFGSELPACCFSWQASLLAERLVSEEGIDVIETQDYEAPLYYFQLRRSRGLGPKRRPPCIVHLHSPTEFIGRYNEWDMTLPRWETAKRMEELSIVAADGLLCPSGFFARQAQIRYGLPQDRVEIIPYPLGARPRIERASDIWSKGAICFVGRLERRKGILEWLGAASAVAQQYPSARFEFVGANVVGANRILSEELIDRAIPRRVHGQFTFHGEVARSALPQFLAQARIAVVPSRWDNFPNACMEAMHSGLPVISTREGGMVEMIVDGRTGWLAEEATAQGLEGALRRALETRPDRLAEMGREAAKSICALCDGAKVVANHLRVRSRFVEQNATQFANSKMNQALDKDYPERNSLFHRMGDDVLRAAGNGKYDSTSVSGQSFTTFQEGLATAKCLVGNPRLAVRICQQAAARFMRSRRNRSYSIV